MACMFSVHLWGQPADQWSIAALFICVWLIYLTDHLADAAKAGNRASSFRHTFFLRYKGVLAGKLSPLLLLAGGLSAAFLPLEKQLAGLILFFFCGLYLFVVQRLKIGLIKETVIAFCYTAGVILASLPANYQVVLGAGAFGSGFACFMLVFSSLLLFALYDEQRDKHAGMSSAVWVLGSRKALRLAWAGCLLAGLAFLLAHQKGFSTPGLLVGLLMVTVQGYLLYAGRSVCLPEEGRLPGDALFLLPWVSLLF